MPDQSEGDIGWNAVDKARKAWDTAREKALSPSLVNPHTIEDLDKWQEAIDAEGKARDEFITTWKFYAERKRDRNYE
ncbi:MAG: hypothetical protein O2783_06135 [Chloroflexi bacterium]|nr:hypothetical protein [Chloroflexota bacterium]